MNLLAALSVIAPIVAVVGILLVVRRVTGGSRTARIVATADVHRAMLDADLTFLPAETMIGVDGHSALVAEAQTGALALAYVVGDRVAARRLSPTDIRRTQWLDDPDGSATLRIQMRDFGCPELSVHIARADLERWRPRVDALLRDVMAQGAS